MTGVALLRYLGPVDSERLRAAKAGDEAALIQVLKWVCPQLLALYRPRFTRSIAWDLVQNTVSDILPKLDTAPEEPRAFSRWARGFGIISERRWLVKEARYYAALSQLDREQGSPAPGVESAFVEQEFDELLDDAIDKLSSPYRSTLRAYRDRGNARDVAGDLGVAIGTVYWRLMSARQKLETIIRALRVTQTAFDALQTPS